MNKERKVPAVAYFCMEFGLDPKFPIYSGGLGILAGDYLKAAHDEGYPVVGVGILWRKVILLSILGLMVILMMSPSRIIMNF